MPHTKFYQNQPSCLEDVSNNILACYCLDTAYCWITYTVAFDFSVFWHS